MLVTALCALSACSGSSGKGRTEPVGNTTREQFAALFAEAACQNLLQCGGSFNDAVELRALVPERSQCLALFAPDIGDGIHEFFDQDVSELSFQSAHADRCLAALPNLCVVDEAEEPENTLLKACSEVFDGSTPLGGSCVRDLDCAGDAYCAPPVAGCGGVCTARVAPGQPCEQTQHCSSEGALHVRCDYGRGDRGSCVAFDRVEQVEAGRPCGELGSTSTRQIGVCASGLICMPGDSAGVACRPPLADGAACTRSGQCQPGSICSQRTREDGATFCTKVIVVGEGEACTSVDVHTISEIRFCSISGQPLECNAQGVCERVARVPEGGSCEEQAPCEEGLVCVSESSDGVAREVCRVGRELGQACEVDSQCLSYFCDSGKCADDDC